jgi:hypothetical protein
MDAFEHALKEERRVQLADGDWSAAERAYIETHE